MSRTAAAAVVRRIRAAGFDAYCVGGCVRDMLLGLEPKDWDIATAARPEECMPLFAATREVGRHFGVLQVKEDSVWIEVATFRSEGPYSDGRRPDHVVFTDARADAERRDFTINALFQDPETGAILDFVGGQADLEARRIRAVGDPAARFAEDALRLLRAVRFACRLDFEIEPRTWDALCAAAYRVATTSAERVRDEVIAILTGLNPRRGFELLLESGLLPVILPEVAAYRGVTQSPLHHPEGDVWEHTLRMLALLEHPSPELALGVLLHDVGKPVTRSQDAAEIHFYGHEVRGVEIASRLLDRLRVANATQDAVLAMIGQHMRFLDAPRMKQSTRRRFVLQPHFGSILELHRLDRLGASGNLAAYDLCRTELAALAGEPVAEPMRPLLSGHDLVELGIAPGPEIGRLLALLVDAQLESEVTNREAARVWMAARCGAVARGPRPGPGPGRGQASQPPSPQGDEGA